MQPLFRFILLSLALFLSLATARAADFSGQWTTSGASSGMSETMTLNLTQSSTAAAGTAISGTFSYSLNSYWCGPVSASGTVSGTASGQRLTFTTVQTSAQQKCYGQGQYDGWWLQTASSGYTITISADVTGDAMQVVSSSACMFSYNSSCVANYVSFQRAASTGGTIDPSKGIPSTLPPVVQNVAASGTVSSLSLKATMKFDDSIKGKTGSIFVGARIPSSVQAAARASGLLQGMAEVRTAQEAGETWYINDGSSWNPLGNALPPYFTGVLDDANSLVSVLNNSNVAGLCGVEVYIGYGTNSSAMLANNTLGKIYTVMCNFDFTGSASGTSASLMLVANVQIATADAGKNGNFYVGRLKNGQWYLHNGSGWVAFTGGAIAPYASGALNSRQIQIFNNENVQSMAGSQVYVGYGLNDADLLANTKYKAIYTIQ